jgi:hypothetical protein
MEFILCKVDMLEVFGTRPGEVLKYFSMIKSSLHGMRTTTL